jgi:hypothetical protein
MSPLIRSLFKMAKKAGEARSITLSFYIFKLSCVLLFLSSPKVVKGSKFIQEQQYPRCLVTIFFFCPLLCIVSFFVFLFSPLVRILDVENGSSRSKKNSKTEHEFSLSLQIGDFAPIENLKVTKTRSVHAFI